MGAIHLLQLTCRDCFEQQYWSHLLNVKKHSPLYTSVKLEEMMVVWLQLVHWFGVEKQYFKQ